MKQTVQERAKVAYDIARALLPELFVADKETFKATAGRIARLESPLLFKLHERSLLLNHVAKFVDASAADYRWLVDKYNAEHDSLTENYSGPEDGSKEDYAYTPQEWKDKSEADKLDKHMSEGPLEESRKDSEGSYGPPEGGLDYPDKNMPKEWPSTKASAEMDSLKAEIAELKDLVKASYKYGLSDKEDGDAEKKAEEEVEDAREAQTDSGASWTKASTEVVAEPVIAEEVEAPIEPMAMEEEIDEEPIIMEEEEDIGLDEEDDIFEAGFNMEEEEEEDLELNLNDDMSAMYSAALVDHELMDLFGDEGFNSQASLDGIEDSVKLGGDQVLPQVLTKSASKKEKNKANELDSLFSQD